MHAFSRAVAVTGKGSEWCRNSMPRKPPRYDVPNAAPEPLRVVQGSANTVNLETGKDLLADWLAEHAAGAGGDVDRAGCSRGASRPAVREQRRTGRRPRCGGDSDRGGRRGGAHRRLPPPGRARGSRARRRRRGRPRPRRYLPGQAWDGELGAARTSAATTAAAGRSTTTPRTARQLVLDAALRQPHEDRRVPRAPRPRAHGAGLDELVYLLLRSSSGLPEHLAGVGAELGRRRVVHARSPSSERGSAGIRRPLDGGMGQLLKDVQRRGLLGRGHLGHVLHRRGRDARLGRARATRVARGPPPRTRASSSGVSSPRFAYTVGVRREGAVRRQFRQGPPPRRAPRTAVVRLRPPSAVRHSLGTPGRARWTGTRCRARTGQRRRRR